TRCRSTASASRSCRASDASDDGSDVVTTRPAHLRRRRAYQTPGSCIRRTEALRKPRRRTRRSGATVNAVVASHQVHLAVMMGTVRDDQSVVDLVVKARNGDQFAWDQIVERYAPLVWAMCQ